jgi:hypothetical protein
MAAGTCAQPAEVGRRRVAWRTVRHPEEELAVVTETFQAASITVEPGDSVMNERWRGRR